MINPKHIVYLSYGFAVLVFCACSSQVDSPNYVFNLEDEFEIRLVQNLSRSGNELALSVKSLLPNHCEDSKIVYNHWESDGEILIRLNNITGADNCPPSEEAPKVSFVLSNPPSQNQSRRLNITIKEIIENEGIISEYDDHFEINMNTLYGLRLDYRELLKMESTTLWGAIDFNNQTDFITAGSFLSEMEENSFMEVLPAGHYGHFVRSTNGETALLEEEMTATYRKAFAFKSSKTLYELEDVFYDFRSDHPEMKLLIYNEFGESL